MLGLTVEDFVDTAGLVAGKFRGRLYENVGIPLHDGLKSCSRSDAENSSSIKVAAAVFIRAGYLITSISSP